MPAPKNPDTVILKNKFYPSGLTEGQIWNYYQGNKPNILKNTKGREVFFYIATDTGLVVRRKIRDSFIRLTASNYDDLFTGRTISIHSTFSFWDDLAIIDIDTDNFSKAKRVALVCFEEVSSLFPLPVQVTIRYTGKRSFHVVLKFSRKMKIDSIRLILTSFLQSNPKISGIATIGLQKPMRAGIPNIEVRRNSFRNGFITLGSLSVWGLRCMEVEPSKVLTFDPFLDAKIH